MSHLNLPPSQRKNGHHSTQSIDTHASGIAESTISFSGLDFFPAVPDSIPNTPTNSDFGRSSPSSFRTNLSSRSKPRLPPGRSPLESSTTPSASGSRSRQPVPPDARTVTPFDWHEGASSIDVDATEDRLLSTSFITGLLQENSRARYRASDSLSFAPSDISEMTYPPRYDPNPVERRPLPQQPIPSSSRHMPSVRPQGGRPPPSAFSPIMENSGHLTDDSDTVYSANGHMPVTIRPASRTILPSVVGVAQATLHNVTRTSSGDVSASRPRQQTKYSSFRVSDYQYPISPDAQTVDYPPVTSVSPFAPPTPPTAPSPEQPFLRNNSRAHIVGSETRQSSYSTKSFVPSFISRISTNTRNLLRSRKKPLPSVPTIPHIPLSTEARYRQEDASAPLPDLMVRAGELNVMLEKGYHPHHSISTYYPGGEDKYEGIAGGYDSDPEGQPSRRGTPIGPASPQTWVTPALPPGNKVILQTPPARKSPWSDKRKLYTICGIFVVIALGAIGAGVGVSLSRRSNKEAARDCVADIAGRACNLNATCVCTSQVSQRCDRLAQNLFDLVPTMNQVFATNYSANAVYASIWAAQGSPSTTKCTSQALLVDVAPGLDSETSPNRTSWAQAALLWNLVQSQDLEAVSKLQKFVTSAPWSQLPQADGAVRENTETFSQAASGFNFNFASQTISPPAISFVSSGQPSEAQASRVESIARDALNRMYSYASASSSQRQKSLATYWSSVLQQRPSDLNVFLSSLIASPILIPFDASFSGSSSGIANSYSTNTSFPPPLGCYPKLSSAQREGLDSVQGPVFGLVPVTEHDRLDRACYGDQPSYGILDVMRLRLPFSEARRGVPTAAVVLGRDVAPRIVLRSGEAFSSLPGGGSPNITQTHRDPRQYGTLNSLNHVVLNYFSAFADRNIAIALVRHVLSGDVVPPSSSSPLGEAFAAGSVPQLELAVFGTILAADTTGAVSSFSDPSGNLFFGSGDASTLRRWAIEATGHSVSWSDGAFSGSIAKDASMSDSKFNEIFSVASKAVDQNQKIPISDITNSLQANGKLSST